jgi:hypothetical protein
VASVRCSKKTRQFCVQFHKLDKSFIGEESYSIITQKFHERQQWKSVWHQPTIKRTAMEVTRYEDVGGDTCWLSVGSNISLLDRELARRFPFKYRRQPLIRRTVADARGTGVTLS